MSGLVSARERPLIRQAATHLHSELRQRRHLPGWLRELAAFVVVETDDWANGAYGPDGVAGLGTDTRRRLVRDLDAQAEQRAAGAGHAWQLVQVRQALPDGGALVLDAADDWAGNERPQGVLVRVARFAANGEGLFAATVGPCALVELVERVCLVAECGVGDLMAAVPAELA